MNTNEQIVHDHCIAYAFIKDSSVSSMNEI